MTPSELQQIKARCDAATCGPWKISNYRPFKIIQRDPTESTYERGDNEFSSIGEFNKASDSIFSANARTDIPYLLDLVEQQQAEIERLKADKETLGEEIAHLDAKCPKEEIALLREEIAHLKSKLVQCRETLFENSTDEENSLREEITRLKAVVETYRGEAGKMMVMREFFRTFPGVGSLLRNAHQHPEHDPDCIYCVLIQSAEKSALATLNSENPTP